LNFEITDSGVVKSLKFFSFVICAILFSGCTKKNISDNRIIIETSKYQGTIALSKLCSQVTYTPLETNSTSLFGQIQKTRVSNNRYYFLSGYSQEKIIAFDRSAGDHVLTIDKIGEGPGEYVMATDFYVNSEDSCIEVYSRGLKKIIQYDGSGNFINEHKINDYINSFIKTEKGYYIDIMRPNGKWAIALYTADLLENQILFDFKDYAWGDINGFSNFNGTISFGASLINNVYHISGTGFEIAYHFDFLEHNIRKDILETDFHDVIALNQELKKNNFAYIAHLVAESDKFIIATIYYQRARWIAIYCKKSGNVKFGNSIFDDLNTQSSVYKFSSEFQVLAFNDNVLFLGIEATYLLEINKDINKNSTLVELIKHIDINDNTIDNYEHPSRSHPLRPQ